MKPSKKPTVLVLLTITIFLSSMFGYIRGVHSEKRRVRYALEQNNLFTGTILSQKASAEKSKEVSTRKLPDPSYYILREENGVLALYHHNSGGEKLWQSYDIPVNLLPESDRNSLSEGIEFSSISAALQAVEDFSG